MVLIVAKCIVNQDVIDLNVSGLDVLIVAKCIVNMLRTGLKNGIFKVLIVAKCIVNCIIVESGFVTNSY